MKRLSIKYSFIAAMFMNLVSLEMPMASTWEAIPNRFRPDPKKDMTFQMSSGAADSTPR